MNIYLYEIICIITSITAGILSINKLKESGNIIYLSILITAIISFSMRAYRLFLNKPGQIIKHPLYYADIACSLLTYLIVLTICSKKSKTLCRVSFSLMIISFLSWPFFPQLGNYPHTIAHLTNCYIMWTVGL
jgi:hypothetical protein